jgi:large subunit ribosomal protein L23
MINTTLIKKPVISEKSMMLANRDNIYTFEVDRLASKTQVKAAIEELFGVEVLGVRTIVQQRVLERTGKRRAESLSAPVKKALVTLKQGQTLDVFNLSTAEAGTTK